MFRCDIILYPDFSCQSALKRITVASLPIALKFNRESVVLEEYVRCLKSVKDVLNGGMGVHQRRLP